MDIAGLLTPAALTAFGQVVLIDVALAGDSVVVIGALAAGLPEKDRKRVILLGIVAAFVLRVIFALGVTWLLAFGSALILGGGILLLYVAWRMWRELRRPDAPDAPPAPARSIGRAALGIAVADVSMSLDNVLAVAGAARAHPVILIAGLVLSVALMGLAANLIARVIERYRWIAWAGLATVVFVAARMIRDGVQGVA